MKILWKKAAIAIAAVLIVYVILFHESPLPAFGKSIHAVDQEEQSLPGDGGDILHPGPARKIVLYYNIPDYFHAHYVKTIFDGCKFSNCTFTGDNKKLESSDAVIFNHGSIPNHPPPKKVGQVWIFTSSESPGHTHQTVRRKEWNGKINWTMSYRRHSDFYFGYGEIIPRSTINRDYKKIYQQKDKDVAWVVSHCATESKREEYVTEMQRYVSVDIYGRCGNRYCEVYKGNENDTCHDVLGHKYKFYLSFENKICKDYTTEKFYFPFTFDKPIIPVARGAYNMKSYVPAEAYIDAADFASPKELALHLAKLASDEQEYIKLLRQKDKYSSKTSQETFKDSMCEICAALHEKRPAKVVNVDDVIFNNQCKVPTDITDRKQPAILGLDNIRKIIISQMKR